MAKTFCMYYDSYHDPKQAISALLLQSLDDSLQQTAKDFYIKVPQRANPVNPEWKYETCHSEPPFCAGDFFPPFWGNQCPVFKLTTVQHSKLG